MKTLLVIALLCTLAACDSGPHWKDGVSEDKKVKICIVHEMLVGQRILHPEWPAETEDEKRSHESFDILCKQLADKK